MGWTTFHETRTAKQYFTDMISRCEGAELVDIAVVNFRTAYIAVRDLKLGYTYCAVYLIHRAPKSYENFGYKDMTEFAGPCVTDCPKRIIDKLTPLDEIARLDSDIGESSLKWAKEWREKVLDSALVKKERNKSLKNGILKTKEPVSFTSGAEFQYFVKEGRQLYALKDFGTECERKVPVRISGWRHIAFDIIGR
jgi:hypothetical protein